MSDTPKPGPEHEKLHRLAGRWVGEETLSASPWGPGGPAIGRYEARVDVDGFCVIQEYVQERNGRASYRAHGVLGWNQPEACVVWYWVDGMGPAPTTAARGHWEGDALVLENLGSPGTRGRYTYRLQGDELLTFTLENSADDGQSWTTLLHASYRRA